MKTSTKRFLTRSPLIRFWFCLKSALKAFVRDDFPWWDWLIYTWPKETESDWTRIWTSMKSTSAVKHHYTLQDVSFRACRESSTQIIVDSITFREDAGKSFKKTLVQYYIKTSGEFDRNSQLVNFQYVDSMSKSHMWCEFPSKTTRTDSHYSKLRAQVLSKYGRQKNPEDVSLQRTSLDTSDEVDMWLTHYFSKSLNRS